MDHGVSLQPQADLMVHLLIGPRLACFLSGVPVRLRLCGQYALNVRINESTNQ